MKFKMSLISIFITRLTFCQYSHDMNIYCPNLNMVNVLNNKEYARVSLYSMLKIADWTFVQRKHSLEESEMINRKTRPMTSLAPLIFHSITDVILTVELKQLNYSSTYHPDVGPGLKLCVDPVASEVWVHLQTCWLGEVNVGLQADSCDDVIGFHLQKKHSGVRGGASGNVLTLCTRGHTSRPSFSWISNLSSLKETDFTRASEMIFTPSGKQHRKQS